MNFIDWIIIILVGLGVTKGFLEGLVRQLVSLMGLVFGTWVAIHYADAAAVFLQKVHEFPEFVWKPLSFFLPFIVTLLLGNLIATIIQRILAGIGLGPLNQIAGAVFGGLKSALLLSILFNLLQLFDRRRAIWITSDHHHALPFRAQEARQLARAGRLAGTLQADHHDDARLRPC